MNKPKKQFHILAQELNLTENEKSVMKARLLEHMRTQAPVVSPYVSFFMFMRNHTIAVALVCILFFSTSTSALANWAMPGDVLYAVKTKVNEPVVGLLATTAFEKKEWQVTLASKRLEEAEKIAIRDDISDEVRNRHSKVLEEQVRLADLDTSEYEESSSSGESVALTMSYEDTQVPSEEIPVSLMAKQMTVSSVMAPETGESSFASQDTILDRKYEIMQEISFIEEELRTARELGFTKEKILRLKAKQIKLRSELLREQEFRYESKDEEKPVEQEETVSESESESESVDFQIDNSDNKTIEELKIDDGSVEGVFDEDSDLDSREEDSKQIQRLPEETQRKIKNLLR